MVLSKRMRGLISWWEATEACVWQVAKEYVVYDGKILPDREAGGWETIRYWPIADSNLFLSFSRLGALGTELSEAAIRRWVRKHGLLQLKDPDGDRLSIDNQKPITLREFREEASQANKALTLFNAIRSENFDALRSRISRVPIDPPGQRGERGPEQVYVDGLPIPLANMAGGETFDGSVRLEAERGLEWFVASRLRGVNLGFDAETGHPRPREVYRPKLVINVPDLRHAIWYQFALLMTDIRPVKFCEVCKDPIFHPRRDQETCSARCRKEKSRRKKARQDSS